MFTRGDIIEGVWGPDYDDGTVNIPVYMRRIREKIEPNPSSPTYLQTVFRFGYRLGD